MRGIFGRHRLLQMSIDLLA